MKIIFLDIDGVLNSRIYDSLRSGSDGNIDITRLPLIKHLIDQSGASVVLTSTWRKHWDPMGGTTDNIGAVVERTFSEAGIKLYGKTPLLDNDRPREITEWLNDHPAVQSYVIFDDIKFGWGKLENNVVKTDYRIGRGLEQCHIDKAIRILQEAKYDKF